MVENADTRVVMPRLGESIVEATIVRWRVRAGDSVTRGQIVAEVETDKATNEIPAPANGIVRSILVEEGTTVSVGTPILLLDTGKSETARPTEPKNEAKQGASFESRAPARLPSNHLAPRPLDERGGPIRSSPAVRRLAREFGLDIARVDGSGRHGRVTRDDILRQARGTPSPRTTPSMLPPVAHSDATPFSTVLPTPLAEPSEKPRRSPFVPPTYRPGPNDRVVPFSRRRAQIAGHMTFSLETSAHVFALTEIDMSRVIAAKNADAPFAEKSAVKLTFMPYVIQAVARALAEHPELNATVLGESIVLRADRNIGVAVDTAEGLVVPVIRRADELGIIGIGRQLQELSERARSGKLSGDDVSGGSFTISNPGKDGNLVGLSIIRQPEVAILRMGAIVKRPVVREIEGEEVIVVRPIMYAALSYDHRVIDGRTGNAFLHRVQELIATTPPALAR